MIDEDIRRSFYIGGRWLRSPHADAIPLINPATEEVAGRIAMGAKADVDRAVVSARKAFESFSRTSREERLSLLDGSVLVDGAPAG